MNLDENGERQQDIKIEDNFHQDMDADHDEDPSEDEEDLIPPQMNQYEEFKDNRNIQKHKIENERPLDSQSEEQMFDSDHLDAFKDGMHKELLQNMLGKEENKFHHKELKDEYDEYEEEVEEKSQQDI